MSIFYPVCPPPLIISSQISTNGSRIPQENQNKIFDIVLSKTDKNIGNRIVCILYIAKGTADKPWDLIRVEPEFEKGATF